MVELLKFLWEHRAKVGVLFSTLVGYVATATAAITLMDKALVARTLGEGAGDWALLLSGVLGAFTGHALTRSKKRVRELEAELDADSDTVQPKGENSP
jgi:hypothetical protein